MMIEFLFALGVLQTNLDENKIPSVEIVAKQNALKPYPYPTATVAVGSPIPDGWVISSLNYGMYAITDLRTAMPKYWEGFTVRKESPIPDGFIVTRELSDSREMICVRGIKYGDPYGAVSGSEFSPIPKGWVAVEKGKFVATIGAPYLTRLRSLKGSALPTGWFVSQRSAPGGTDEIANANGARYLDSTIAALASPLPENWVIAQVTGTHNRITYLGGGAKYLDSFTVDVGSPIPSGWVSILNNRTVTELVYTIGAKKDDSLAVKVSSPIPRGWVIVGSDRGGYRIRFLG